MSDTETNAASPEEQTGAETSTVKNPTETLEAEIASLKDKLLRALAETENVRRRGERDKEDAGKFAVAKFAQNLLPVADNLRRAIEAVPAEGRSNELLSKLLDGIEATERSLLQSFEKAGISAVSAIDQPFNPNFHEVMVEIEYPDKPAGTIVQLFENGYMIHERLLRPARVGVAKGGPTQAERLDTSA